MPAIRICLVFEVWPEMIEILLFGTLNCFDKSFINSAFAAPPTGGEASLIFTAPSNSPTISLRDARGTTRTVKYTAPFFSDTSIKSSALSRRANDSARPELL